MPLAIPLPELREVQHNLPATPSITVPGVPLTGGTANTKGAWASLYTASISYDSHFMMLCMTGTQASATRTDTLVDIAIGPAGGGSEQIILPDLLCGWSGSPTLAASVLGTCLYLPIFVPKGVRVSARCQGVQASKVVDVMCWLWGGANNMPWGSFRGADAYGIASSGASMGTVIASPATAGAESAWTNIGATTSRPYSGLFLGTGGTQADVTMTQQAYHIEVGVNSVTFAEYWLGTDSTEWTAGPIPSFPYFGKIPAGSQLQIRYEQSGTDTQDIDFALYGLY
jgi:hypothetical protein